MNIKGVVLAGGTGSRLFPLTKVTNKHLLPVGKKPMIFHPIEQLVGARITDIMIVTGPDHMGDIVGLLGSGREFGCQFTYRVQDEAKGIAHALGLARDFARDHSVAVVLGDNIFQHSLSYVVQRYADQQGGARVVVKEVHDPSRYGVASIANNTITAIVEKPQNPASSFAVTGFYLYDHNVFSVIDQLKPSGRGELEITDVNNYYAQHSKLHFDVAEGWWTDAGTFDSLILANDYLKDA